MKHLVSAAAVLILAMASQAEAASNLNLSKSNYFRLTCPTGLVTPAQAAALLADLDKTPALDDVKLQQTIKEALSKRGTDPARVKKILIRPAGNGKRSIILLDSVKPEDERAAIAVSDEGVPADKPTKKGGTSKK